MAKEPETEGYQVEDFLHDASIKTTIRIIDHLELETLEMRWAKRKEQLNIK